MARPAATVALAAGLAVACAGCFRGPGRALGLIAATAIVTSAIVSSTPPPPPRVVYAPPPVPGYRWQPGYWIRHGDDWRWVDGRWVAEPPGYRWVPAHWAEAPDGTWHFLRGHWAPSYAPPPE